MEIPQKIQSRGTLWSSNSTFRYLSKENENTNSKRYLNPLLIATLLVTAKMWKQPNSSSLDKWIKKMWNVYTHTHTIECYSAIKKRKSCHVWERMDLEDIMKIKWVRQWMTNTLLSRLYVESKKEQNQIHRYSV